MERDQPEKHTEQKSKRVHKFTRGLRGVMTMIVPENPSVTSDKSSTPGPVQLLPRLARRLLARREHERPTSGYYLSPNDWPWDVKDHDLTIDEVYGVLARFTERAQTEPEERHDDVITEGDTAQRRNIDEDNRRTKGPSSE